jgi:hypothetical protein
VQILVVVDLQATATEVGLVRAAQWLPYLAFGVLAGALVDRVRRRLRVLWLCDLGRAVTLATVPMLYAAGLLDIVSLVAVLLVFGLLSVVNDAAAQSALPRLVDRPLLAVANARLEQSGAVAQTGGPVLAGALVRLTGAPAAVVVDAVSFVVSAALLRSIPVVEAAPESTRRRHLLREVAEGARWVYTHEMLAPTAIWSHVWFFANAILSVVFVPYAVRELGLDALAIGIAYAGAGVGAVLGGALSGAANRRLQVGGTDIAAYALLGRGLPAGGAGRSGGRGIAAARGWSAPPRTPSLGSEMAVGARGSWSSPLVVTQRGLEIEHSRPRATVGPQTPVTSGQERPLVTRGSRADVCPWTIWAYFQAGHASSILVSRSTGQRPTKQRNPYRGPRLEFCARCGRAVHVLFRPVLLNSPRSQPNRLDRQALDLASGRR